jgi:hypothetical protein
LYSDEIFKPCGSRLQRQANILRQVPPQEYQLFPSSAPKGQLWTCISLLLTKIIPSFGENHPTAKLKRFLSNSSTQRRNVSTHFRKTSREAFKVVFEEKVYKK